MDERILILLMIGFISVILTITITLCVMLGKRQRLRSRDVLRLLADYFNGHLLTSHMGIHYRCLFNINGIDAEALFVPQQSSTPPMLYLQIKQPQALNLTLRKRNIFDRLCMLTRLVIPLSCQHNPLLDNLWISANRADRKLQTWMDTAESINALVSLFHRFNLKNIWFDKNGITAVRVLTNGEQVDPKTTESLLSELQKTSVPAHDRLGLTTSRATSNNKPAKTFPASPLPFLLGGPLVFFIIAGTTFLIAALDLYPPLFPFFKTIIQQVWPIITIGTVCIIGFTFYLTYHLTNRHIYITVFFILVIPALFLTNYGGFLFLNGYLSRKEPEFILEAKLFRTYIKGKGSRQIEFVIDNKHTDNFDCMADYYKLEPGTPFLLSAKKGAFCIDWLADFAPVPEKNPAKPSDAYQRVLQPR